MTSPAASGRNTDDDLLVLLILGALGLGSVGTLAITGWAKTVSWLLAHQVLVAAGTHPLLAAPHAGGAGLDLPRLALATAVVLLLIVTAVGAVRRTLQGRALQ